MKKDVQEFSKFYSRMQAVERKQQYEELTRKLATWSKKLQMINLLAENAIRMIEKINKKIDEVKVKLEEMAKE